MKAINLTRNTDLASNVVLAKGFFKRMKGLLLKKGMMKGEALLIAPCKGVHTIGMRFSIDVVFLNKNNEVIALRKSLRPNQLTPIYINSLTVLELPAGVIEATNTQVGDKIEIA